jgi:16S rRNA (cytidine1402-2'-O)-methyltransferase
VSTHSGTLFVVATPIGNLGDISARALDTLRACDLILAEDTRVTRRLLERYGIATRIESYHDHNERDATPTLVRRLLGGVNMALVTDAGTPGVSDPGLHLLRAAHAGQVPVRVVPGPSAVTAALSAAGLPAQQFAFEGYLPARRAARARVLARLREEPRTIVLLEAPHRIAGTLAALATAFGAARRMCVARELTKLHEWIRTATIAEHCAEFERDPGRQRGEFVLVVEGADAALAEQMAFARARCLLERLLAHVSVATAVAIAHEFTGAPRNALYDCAIAAGPDHSACESGD